MSRPPQPAPPSSPCNWLREPTPPILTRCRRRWPRARRTCSPILSSSINRKGRSAGLSNGAEILAGEAPPAVDGLTAEMSKDGVLLRWTPVPPEASPVAIRLVRKLLTPPAQKPSQGPLAQPAEPLQQSLLVEPGSHADRALDTSIRFGETYEYRAQRVARIA